MSIYLIYINPGGDPPPPGGFGKNLRHGTLKNLIFRLRLRRSFFTIRHYHVFNFGYSLFSFFLIDLWTEDHDEELSKRSCALSVCPLDTKPMVVFGAVLCPHGILEYVQVPVQSLEFILRRLCTFQRPTNRALNLGVTESEA